MTFDVSKRATSRRSTRRMVAYDGLGLVEHWTEREIDKTAFEDARLVERFGELLKQIGDGMGGSIPHRISAARTATRQRAGDDESRRSLSKVDGRLVRCSPLLCIANRSLPRRVSLDEVELCAIPLT
ncbi:transposase DNA-binding-containing protein [Bradyrhizobium zhanjiangense]|uniref:transposase DNA-binding-containing protein n=1 Tax=Bradyrhizobium zhanjiangense TaxID=1325107 RepID=UPI00100881AB